MSGLVSNGISRYIGEEIDKTSNWMAKLGIGLLGAAFLMPVTAFADPKFGALDSGQNWLTNGDFGTQVATELIFDSVNQVVSQEAYKALEDSLGEEWYADLLRSSVNSVVSAGFGVMKNAIHNNLMPKRQAVVIVDEKTGKPVIVADGNKKIEATEIIQNEDGTSTAKWEGLDVEVVFDGNGNITKQLNKYYSWGEFSDYKKNALYEDGKVVDWEIDKNILLSKYALLLGDAWDNVIVKENGTVSLTQFISVVKASGGSFSLTTFSGVDLQGDVATNYISKYGYEGVDLKFLDSNGNTISAPAIELNVDTFADIIDPHTEVLAPSLSPITTRHRPLEYDVEYWKVSTFHNWNTYNGQGFGLDTRLGDGGIAVISIPVDAGGIAGGLAIAGIGVVGIPISGGTGLAAVAAGGTIAFFSGLNLIDDTYQLYGALACKDNSFKDFTSYRIFFGENATTVKTAFSTADYVGNIRKTIIMFKDVLTGKIRSYRATFFEAVQNFNTIRDIRSYIEDRLQRQKTIGNTI